MGFKAVAAARDAGASYDLTPNEARILELLAEYVHDDEDVWEAWPSQATLAKYSRLSRQSVNAVLQALERKRLITKIPQRCLPNGRKPRSNFYALQLSSSLTHSDGADPSGGDLAVKQLDSYVSSGLTQDLNELLEKRTLSCQHSANVGGEREERSDRHRKPEPDPVGKPPPDPESGGTVEQVDSPKIQGSGAAAADRGPLFDPEPEPPPDPEGGDPDEPGRELPFEPIQEHEELTWRDLYRETAEATIGRISPVAFALWADLVRGVGWPTRVRLVYSKQILAHLDSDRSQGFGYGLVVAALRETLAAGPADLDIPLAKYNRAHDRHLDAALRARAEQQRTQRVRPSAAALAAADPADPKNPSSEEPMSDEEWDRATERLPRWLQERVGKRGATPEYLGQTSDRSEESVLA